MADDSSWPSIFSEIKCKYDTTYAIIQRAVVLDEEDHGAEAVEKYKEAIQLIDSTLAIEVRYPENADSTWDEAVFMIRKLKKTRAEILTRINLVHGNRAEEEPPSYNEAIASSSTSEIPQTYNELAAVLHRMRLGSEETLNTEVIFTHEGVKLYFISPNEEVSSILNPQTLKIMYVAETEPGDEGKEGPRAVLYVGNWVYPLIPGVSPCFRTDYGAFILPNVYSEIPGSSIGIILPEDADAGVYEILEDILYGIVGETKSPKDLLQPKPDFGERFSNGVISGATTLSDKMKAKAGQMGNFLNRSAPKLMNRLNPAEKPSEIPEKVSKGVHIAESATHKAAKVTGQLARQVGVATVKMAHFLAPHIQKQGTRLLTSGFNMPEEKASAKMKGVLTATAGAVEGFATVYSGLEHSAFILAKSLKDNTVKVVEHKYGESAAELAGGSLSTMGNVLHLSHNLHIVQPDHVVSRTAKEAGKVVKENADKRDKEKTEKHDKENSEK